jgi:hypothetical protein
MGTGVGAGVVLISPEGKMLRYTIRLNFLAANNIAEYEGLINGLCIAIEREGLLDVPRCMSPSTASFTSAAHQRWEC